MMSGETVLVTQPTVLTIGHSTRALEPFIEMLRAHGVKHLADVRTVPRSRHNPQFNRDTLPEALRLTGIAYRSEVLRKYAEMDDTMVTGGLCGDRLARHGNGVPGPAKL